MPRLLFAIFGRRESRPPGLEDGRAGPAPHQMRQSGKGAVHPNWTEEQELALVVRVQVSWTQGRESRRTDPVPVACCIG